MCVHMQVRLVSFVAHIPPKSIDKHKKFNSVSLFFSFLFLWVVEIEITWSVRMLVIDMTSINSILIKEVGAIRELSQDWSWSSQRVVKNGKQLSNIEQVAPFSPSLSKSKPGRFAVPPPASPLSHLLSLAHTTWRKTNIK